MGFTPPFLDLRRTAGTWTAYAPSSTSTDDLVLRPNTTDTYPYIIIYGNEYIMLVGASYRWADNTGTSRFKMSYTSPDLILESVTADKNISLVTAGTGVVKFGTYTAGAATDSTGYITILDAAGNTRKLMVQA